MTKPAGVFLQIIGVLMILYGFTEAAEGGSQWPIWAGLGLLVWGGIGIRKRIDQETGVTKTDDDRK
ncbi:MULTISPECIES: hypothetical protein [unclassified Thioalkalivibrio]|uniref:hypothetical protein n=1 Tax=unclassified Thioalkalivibrio TaxID=2621013 RepID=UPI000380E039|nr:MULTISPECIES: hypothetical protein [unclassified Thioalkalivibrio]